ncbi:MAG: NAD-dependent epimerase/dehydratase family protein [Chitinophagales bacterium]|nr:NAD-dependent epimerase/dehydratase family protein [Chitinophagales bacterium]
METILITGGTGLIGNYLTSFLQNAGYKITYLSRKKNTTGTVKTYLWDLKNYRIDEEAITTCNHIIHLAGANVADKRGHLPIKKKLRTAA